MQIKEGICLVAGGHQETLNARGGSYKTTTRLSSPKSNESSG